MTTAVSGSAAVRSGTAGPSARETWSRLRVGPALLALCAGWFALVAWSGMVEHPHRYLVASLVIGLLVTLTGIVSRALHSPVWATIAAQVVVGLLGLDALA